MKKGSDVLKNNKALRFIIQTSKKELFRLILVTIFSALNAFLSVYFALAMRDVINNAVEGNLQKVKFWGIVLIAVALLDILIYFFNRVVSAQMSAHMEIAFREATFKRIIRKEYSEISKFHSGEIQNRLFNDVNVISGDVSTLLPQFLALVTRLVAAFCAVYIVDQKFAVALLFVGSLFFVFARMFRGIMMRTHKDMQVAAGEVRAHSQEAVENVLVIKAFGMENAVYDQQEQKHKKYYKKKMIRANFSAATSSGIITIMKAGYIYAVIWGAIRILNPQSGFGYGDFVAIMQLITQIQSPFANLSGSLSKYYAMIASAERLLEITELPEETGEQKDANEIYKNLRSIKLDNVSFSYGRTLILENADAEIERGKLTVIAGISGIGKSTLIKLLMGVIKPNAGRIYTTGEEDGELDSSTRGLFAYVPQGNLLMSGTIAENLRLARDNATKEEIESALRVACADFVFELPKGIETELGERGSGLSEGQIQRLAIARAVLFDAPIFLLDEATSALDEQTERRVLENIMKLSGKTCVCISHRSAAMEVCDKEIYIKDGKVFTGKE